MADCDDTLKFLCEHVRQMVECLDEYWTREGTKELVRPFNIDTIAALLDEYAHESTSPRMAALRLIGLLVEVREEVLRDMKTHGVH